MRLKFNKEADGLLKASKHLIQSFPIKLEKETHLEIGMGKGQMITQLAMNNPHIDYIGCEKYGTVALYALKKIEKEQINNLKLLVEDADKITEIFADKVDRIYLTFSDPWPKKRHAKRRLLHRNFLNKFKEILKPDGVLIFKTDNDPLFEFALEEIEAIKAHLIYSTTDLHNSEKNANNIRTEYEIKWSEKGKNINYLELKFTE
ncbi:tRNA (guanosine(46)-N7)-methyltransferase TrmB [Mycoplasma phocoenae]|uniref:tRNA (guanine-N(7)-)-methyltransferase n=1 Tax=Mycoplasma phocoenae TaxID=754517 RepID=A0A858U6K4_9MOLU|nr:tRNA (guanosine(46)-N7)-methyltransferase TrmB [Mycoplasma phocoenae]QJG66895.1 tRNA (guanosine(46)-N7)-methyltransferase TrmB [Mycoplasma phocoenae]